MSKRKRPIRALLGYALLVLLMVTACNADGALEAPAAGEHSDEAGATATPDAASTTAAAATAATPASGLPTGPVVTVDKGYEPPGDHVPSTGAHLPANGKPTLVYVDAIW